MYNLVTSSTSDFFENYLLLNLEVHYQYAIY